MSQPMDTDTIERPEDVPASPPEPSVDELLSQFDAMTKPEPATDSNIPAENTATEQSTDQQIADLLGPDPRIAELEGQLNAVNAENFRKQELADFDGFSKKLQAELGPNVDENFARTNLLALAAERPELDWAWKFRSLSDADRRAADAEFQALELLYAKAQAAPPDPRKANALAQMERRGQELGLMMNAHKILNNVWRDVVGRAKSVKPPIDADATQVHFDVAAAVRGASAPFDLKEPPVEWGKMSGAEGRRLVKDKFGFDPGWGH